MRRIFYGWIITGLSALANTLAWSVRSTFSLFYVALLQHFGWGRAETAFGYSLSWLLLLPFSPLAGRLNDRLGPRVLVPIGGVLLATGLALTVFAAFSVVSRSCVTPSREFRKLLLYPPELRGRLGRDYASILPGHARGRRRGAIPSPRRPRALGERRGQLPLIASKLSTA